MCTKNRLKFCCVFTLLSNQSLNRIIDIKTEQTGGMTLDGTVTLKKIAEINGTSIRTVYNALHSSASVDLELKARILKTAQELNYFPQAKNSRQKAERCIIAALIPSNPIYFWSEAQRGMQEAIEAIDNKTVSLEIFVYSNIDMDDDFLYCIERARNSNPDAYIIVPPCSETSKNEIQKLNKPIVFLNEYIHIDDTNETSFIGADTYSDGKLFAETCQNFLLSNPRVLIVHGEKDNYMVQRRCQGFCDYLPKGVVVIGEIRPGSSTTIAAKMAQIIHKEYIAKENIPLFDCIFVATGLIPQVCLTLKKLNLKIPCIGCEKPNSNFKYIKEGILYGELVQSIKKQGLESVNYALKVVNKEDIACRKVTIPSNIYIYGQRIFK
jgi:DNA-binding LacI/PurR family transcriptional regulator